MKSKKLEKLVQDFLNGNLTDKDFNKLIDGYLEAEVKQLLEESVKINYLISRNNNKIDSKTAFVDFMSKIKPKENHKILRFRASSLLKYAAIFIGILGLGYFIIYNSQESVIKPSLKINDETITLKLNNGKRETIRKNNVTQVLDDEGNVIATQKGERIIYRPNKKFSELVYNELYVPNGKKFEVELSDGTLVHINAGSTFKYPISFVKEKDRQVFIDGEAYFDVAKDSLHPFVVGVGEINVRVLGTKFNINSYEDGDNINTVLVSGRVQLYGKEDAYDEKLAIDLTPGNKASWNKQKKTYEIEKVDAEIYISWMEGKLIFKDMAFKNIRKELERKYNVTIVNNNKLLEDNTFNARFDVESIEEVMEVFNRNFGINYKIEDNNIIIE